METTGKPLFVVLDVIVRTFDERGSGVLIEASHLAERTDMSPGQVSLVVHDLHPDYIEMEAFPDPDSFRILAVTDQARRLLVQWPDAIVNRLAVALRAAMEEASPDNRLRLEGAADTISGFARDVAITTIRKAAAAPPT